MSFSGKDNTRRVSFFGKCQVIPPTKEFAELDNPLDDYFARNATKDHQERKRGPLHLFRNRKHRSWAAGEEVDDNHSSSQSPWEDQERPSSLSPSLPINHNPPPRRKLISPPPPTPQSALEDDPTSPVLDAPHINHIHSPMTPSSPVQCPVSEEGPTSSPVAPLARPVAVRKPLALGSSSEHITEGTKSNAEDKNTQNHSPPSLKVPQIVYRPTAFHFKDHRGQPNIHTILNWEEEKDDDSDSGEEKSGSASELVLAEEDLNGECVCVDCEQKMLDALSPDYSPPWTRPARRKYLADCKEKQRLEDRKAKPPIWLRAEDSERAASTSSVRKIQADEVDTKQGVRNIALVSKPDDGHSASQKPPLVDRTSDDALMSEVNEELRLREDEARHKKNRDIRRLSCDTGTGLRVGSGGARAMMRQLEEAEQAERRARVERSRSPKIETSNEPERPMGAVQDAPGKPFSPPPRLASPASFDGRTSSPGIENYPSRTPSPLKKVLHAVKEEVGLYKGKEPALQGKNHGGSSSPLVKREKSLGIPVQSNTSSPKSRNSWHNSHESLASQQALQKKLEEVQLGDSKATSTGSHGRIKPGKGQEGETETTDKSSEQSTPGKDRASVVRSQSVNTPRRSSPLAQRSTMGEGAGSATSSPPPQIPRANTVGTSNAFDVGVYTPSHHRIHHDHLEGRLEHAREKAKSGIRGLVKRMKN